MKLKLLLLFLFSVHLCSAQVDLNLGLQAYYPFSGNANDASGNGNNPVFNNASLTSDRFGNANSAYQFNGTNSYIRIPNSSSLNISTNKISLCAWIKPMGYYTGPCYNNAIIMKQYGDYHDGNYNLRFSDAVTGCTSSATTTGEVLYGSSGNANGTGSAVAASPIVELNNWYSVVYTNDGTNAKIYVNCELKTTTSVTSNYSLTNAEDLFLGHMNNITFPYWYNGIMDEIRIYNRAINQDEVNLYGDCNVTPVVFTDFTTKPLTRNSIQLTWQTAQEINGASYSIERSINPNNGFKSIAKLPAKNSINNNNYLFNDDNVTNDITYYYRIVAIRNDGEKKYSAIKKVIMKKDNSFITVSPNPTDGLCNLSMKENTRILKIEVINTMGQIIMTYKNPSIVSNNAPLNFKYLPNGAYWLKVFTPKHTSIEKIIKSE